MRGCARTGAAYVRPVIRVRDGAEWPAQLAANFRSLIAAKSLTSPPTRLVA
jgi:hypothetical protein